MDLVQIQQLIGNFGLPLALVLLLIWAAKIYVPRIIDAHLNFVSSVDKTQKSLAETQKTLTLGNERLIHNTERITEVLAESRKDILHCKNNTRAMLGFCDTFEAAAQGHPKEAEILASLQNVKQVLESSIPH